MQGSSDGSTLFNNETEGKKECIINITKSVRSQEWEALIKFSLRLLKQDTWTSLRSRVTAQRHFFCWGLFETKCNLICEAQAAAALCPCQQNECCCRCPSLLQLKAPPPPPSQKQIRWSAQTTRTRVVPSLTALTDGTALVRLVLRVHALRLRTGRHRTQNLPAGFAAALLTRRHLQRGKRVDGFIQVELSNRLTCCRSVWRVQLWLTRWKMKQTTSARFEPTLTASTFV